MCLILPTSCKPAILELYVSNIAIYTYDCMRIALYYVDADSLIFFVGISESF
jgi:hypothetical protein